MFVRGVFQGISVIFLSFLFVKCSANENVVFISKEYFKVENPLQCYDCNSEYDPRCGDPFDPYSIGKVNCSEIRPPEHLVNTGDHPNDRLKPTVCRKIVQTVKNNTVVNKRVIRECGYVQDTRDDKECVKRSGTKDVQVIYCACTHPFCNAGINIRPSLLSVGQILFLVIYVLFRY